MTSTTTTLHRARDDYPTLAGFSLPGTINGRPHHTETGKEFARALAEIDQLRGEIETCEVRNEHLRIQFEECLAELNRYRAALGHRRASRR